MWLLDYFRRKRKVDIGAYIASLRKKALPDSSSEFDQLLREYLSVESLPSKPKELAMRLNELSVETQSKLFTRLVKLNFSE